MSKSNITTTQGPVIPELDPNRVLERSLKSQGLPVTTSALDYARQNAQGALPQNTQSTGSASYTPGEFSDAAPIEDSVYPEAEEPAPQRYANQGEDQLDAPNLQGMPRTEEEVRMAYAENRRKQEERANAVSYGWNTPESLAAAFPRETIDGRPVVVPSERGKIVSMARDLGTQLSVMSAESGNSNKNDISHNVQTGMALLQQAYGLSDVEASTMATTAFAMTAPMLSGATKTVNGIMDDPELDGLSNWGADEGSDLQSPMMAVEGGLKQDTIDGALGNTISKLNKRNKVDPDGYAVVPRSDTIPPKVVGALVRQALVNNGVLLEDIVNGEKVYRLSPITGTEFYNASKQMARDVVTQGRGRSQTVPATSTGNYAGAATNSRHNDIKGDGYESTKAMAEAKRIAGSIALVVSPIKSFFNAIFTNQAVNEQFPDKRPQDSRNGAPNPGILVGEPIQGLASTSKLLGFNSDDSGDAKKAKATTMLKLSNYNGQNVIENAPRFAIFWENYSVHRLHNDVEDVNVQRDKQSRAVVTGVRKAMDVSKTMFHKNGISKMEAAHHYDQIQKQVNRGVVTLTDTQREVAWFATIGKVLDVGSTVGKVTDSLVVADMINLTTPEFILNAARIGKVLASIVPQNKSAIAEVNLDLRKLQLNLDEKQLKVLNDFIGSSKKKDWGYRLGAYLDAYNYMVAKEKGTPFSPQATVEIDMNSAGRMYLAFDGADEEVLRRTGVLWEKQTDSMIQDTQPGGNPRALFLQEATNSAVHYAISDDRPEIKAAWKSILKDILGRNDRSIADAFGKGVLLTTDYGKPMSFHFEEARRFLAAYPDILNQLLPFYEKGLNDVVKDLNSIYHATLKSTVSRLQMETPKHIVSSLQMLNRLPKAKGFWGEQIAVGSSMPKETGDYTILTSNNGDRQRINHTKRVMDAMTPARPKTLMNEDGVEGTFIPGPGSAASNQIGPIMGQYRESILVAETMNYINGGFKPSDMLFMQPVFDNLMLNSDSYLQVMHAANNIILPKVLEWDLVNAIVDDYKKQRNEALVEIRAKKNVDIGIKADVNGYPGTTLTIDREVGYIEKNIAAGKIVTPRQRAFLKYVLSPASGYQRDSADRPDNITITSDQMVKLSVAYYEMKIRTDAREENDNILKWVRRSAHARKKFLHQVQEMARKGNIYFMN